MLCATAAEAFNDDALFLVIVTFEADGRELQPTLA